MEVCCLILLRRILSINPLPSCAKVTVDMFTAILPSAEKW